MSKRLRLLPTTPGVDHLWLDVNYAMADPPPPVGTSPPPSNKGRDNEEKAAGQLPAGAAAAHDVSAKSAESVEVTSSHSPPAHAKRRRGGEGSKGTRSNPRKRSSKTRPRSASTSPSKVPARTPPQNQPADPRPSQPDENRQNRCATVSPIPSCAGDPPCPNDEKTNPGGWNPYVFRPKFKGKHGEYQYHALSSGATPVPYNEESKISSKSADGMYNTKASKVRWSIVAAGARTTCVLMAEEASWT